MSVPTYTEPIMRTLSLITALLLLPLPAFATGIEFDDLSIDEALAQAAANNTLVFVDVYATWCGPCQRLDEEVFPTDVVGAATENLVTLRINAEEGEGPGIVDRWHVVGYPTMLLLQPDGTEVDRLFGFMPADELAETLTGYIEGRGTIDDLRAQVAADPTNLELLEQLAQRTAVRGERETAEELFAQLIAADLDNSLGLRSAAHHFLGKYTYLRGAADYEAALEQFAIVLEQFPTSEEAISAQIQSAIAHARAGNAEQATAFFEGFIAMDPGSSGTYNTVAWVCFQERVAMDYGMQTARAGLEVDPTDASLWDTYAELLNASGDVQGAIDAIQQAVAHDPETPYYGEQLDRFQTLLAN